ncbi:helix-turn-helix domain-containing protein [Ectothiorhodospira variabilis]|uniref:helix-turn-helix domain-containing protein n=1 Tax=Ectothiorhodospira variabilis TaxID=505694 RepID=UPI001EFBC82F|nr:helix-turn-helix transcriptional regulator [Ectothiorhodospira variabilis]MCG5495962.1 helix-turn-helix transcriptional regulator [Ectothiorhodospira variabilis]MCG5498505.1 helix-turn-helix transcriptional regulator [Ectothiorhodospira variabilis]MCG5505324.1 helix-turn-helix transcriptional regulator [Ectothiorhodospira variabilis]MCG5508510.1 helix-turn-helix transcriptional regulator [Ectothiorhodospira variabilis]
MIRFRLKELMAEKSFQEGRRLTYEEIAQATGINRTTLSKIANQKGYNTTTDNLDALCAYFDCSVCELAERVKEIPNE